MDIIAITLTNIILLIYYFYVIRRHVQPYLRQAYMTETLNLPHHLDQQWESCRPAASIRSIPQVAHWPASSGDMGPSGRPLNPRWKSSHPKRLHLRDGDLASMVTASLD